MEVAQPYSNHNGGQLAFGPDGFLYVGLGDGGAAGDPLGHGRNRATLLGSILRIDVSGASAETPYTLPADNPFAGDPGSRGEIWAYGLRNPWRFSFDREAGRLWAGDVGQNRVEEVDVIGKGGDYGWNTLEGSRCFSPATGCDAAGTVLPVWEYPLNSGNCSVIGGYVYRGERLPSLAGAYVFGDFCSGTYLGAPLRRPTGDRAPPAGRHRRCASPPSAKTGRGSCTCSPRARASTGLSPSSARFDRVGAAIIPATAGPARGSDGRKGGMYKGYRVIDADSHYHRVPDLRDDYIDPEFRDRLPETRPDGVTMVDNRGMSTVQWKRMDYLNEMWDTEYGAYAERGFDPKSYLMAMEDQGVDKMALFGVPTVGAWGLDPAVADAMVRGFNRWVADFVADTEDRVIPIGQIDLRNVDAAIREVERCVKEYGFKGFFTNTQPPIPGITLDKPYYDPLWSTFEEFDVPLCCTTSPARGTARSARTGSATGPRRGSPSPSPSRCRWPSSRCSSADVRAPPRPARRRPRIGRGLAALHPVVLRRALRALPRLRPAADEAEAQRVLQAPVLPLRRA